MRNVYEEKLFVFNSLGFIISRFRNSKTQIHNAMQDTSSNKNIILWILLEKFSIKAAIFYI